MGGPEIRPKISNLNIVYFHCFPLALHLHFNYTSETPRAVGFEFCVHFYTFVGGKPFAIGWMLGTIINTAAIIVGTVTGAVAKKGIKPEYSNAVKMALGLCVVILGVNTCVVYMAQSPYPVLFIISMALGAVIGTLCDIDGRVKRLLTKRGDESLATGLTTGILLYCIGTLSIVGPMMSALKGDNTFLFTNATLDLVSSMVLAASYGIGMLWAAPVLFVWQGGIYMVSKWLGASLINATLLADISIVGGVLIFCSGLSILNIKDCKTLNLLPALVIPPVWYIIVAFVG